MSPVPDPENKTNSSHSTKSTLDQTTIKPSANQQRVQEGKHPITHEPDPNAKRDDIASGNGNNEDCDCEGHAAAERKEKNEEGSGDASADEKEKNEEGSGDASADEKVKQDDNSGEDVDMEDPRIRHPSNKKLDPKGEGYSLRDVPRLHFRDQQHEQLHWPASAPRIILDATEDEFHKQAKPKPKPPQPDGKKKEDDEKESHNKPAGGDGEEGDSKADEKHKATGDSKDEGEGKDKKEDGEEKKEGGEGKDKKEEGGEQKKEGGDGEQKAEKEGGPPKKSGSEQKKDEETTGDKHDADQKREEQDSKPDIGPPNQLHLLEHNHINSLQTDPGTTKSSPAYLRALTIEIDDRDRNTPDNWVPRRVDLIRNTGSHPMNAEPPLTELMRYGLVTPNMVHYIRNHGAVPFLEWGTHQVEVCGMVERPTKFNMDEIAEMPWINIPVTVACDGNRRGEVNMIKRSTGFTWGAGALATSYWKGVPLAYLLKQVGVKEGAKYVCFEGSDHLPNGAYGTSLTLSYVMDERNDAMIAYEMNGRALPPDHGYPCRTILPGHIGGRTVKWLKKIIVSDKESTSWYHWHDNRFIPPHITSADEAERDKWWYQSDTLLLAGPLQSVITQPSHGQRLPLAELGRDGREIEIAGYAYCGGGRKVSLVQVSIDGGRVWKYATRRFLEQPMRWEGERWWTWCHWTVNVNALELLQSQEVRVRAFDSSHTTQPDEPVWNLGGFQNNSIYKVKLAIRSP
ncbi:hypothetical protein HK097_007131, partial [Rhizophlyctis rosea]